MPRPALHIGPKKLVESPAPNLELGLYRTQSSALHDLKFTGDLQPWPGFLSAVQTTHQSHTWRNKVLGLTLQTRDPYTHGNVEVGDETSVQGRFHKYFGDVLNSIFTSQSKEIRFADFKCVQSSFAGTPDVIMKDVNRILKVVGELKVPWVYEHFLFDKLNNNHQLRNILAQPIRYMQSLGSVYGFISDYHKTIFLRQLVNSQGIWRIEYSPVVQSSTTYDRRAKNPPVVSSRQCFFHIGCEALNQGPVNNTTPRWVIRR
ncbi:uncharacterized protein N7529_008786 [Penicillium soppii]|uniref:uncharacterized protein n=1 Tax=Penicillium soppii TaxID=69789 RepID=UPI0025487034|nr:uncharacterized protein N7529_008786 [Penicillium soppii]KAJ5861476.1 hypothetical protein N7529_008786 [Penicillium soppii]